jgi:hypothetical protein
MRLQFARRPGAPRRRSSPAVGLQHAQHLLDLQVRVLHRRAQVPHLVVVEDAQVHQPAHVRLLRLPPRQLVVLLHDLAERFHVEAHEALQHVDAAVGLVHGAAQQPRVLQRLGHRGGLLGLDLHVHRAKHAERRTWNAEDVVRALLLITTRPVALAAAAAAVEGFVARVVLVRGRAGAVAGVVVAFAL